MNNELTCKIFLFYLSSPFGFSLVAANQTRAIALSAGNCRYNEVVKHRSTLMRSWAIREQAHMAYSPCSIRIKFCILPLKHDLVFINANQIHHTREITKAYLNRIHWTNFHIINYRIQFETLNSFEDGVMFSSIFCLFWYRMMISSCQCCIVDWKRMIYFLLFIDLFHITFLCI